jgi:hypothetical protein
MFYELSNEKNLVPLTKQQIHDLRGGDIRGERIFLSVDLGRDLGYAVYEKVYEATVRNQMRSQNKSLPEGYLCLKSELYRNAVGFRYDIASGRCVVPFFDSLWPGKISCGWRAFPALVLQPPVDSDEMSRLKRRARTTTRWERLCRALAHHPECVATAAELLAESLGLPTAVASSEDPAKRILKYIRDADAQVAVDLRRAIMAEGPSPQPADAYSAAA